MEHNNRVSIKYSITTLICTAIVGAVIIFAFPSGGLVSSILFIFINLSKGTTFHTVRRK